MKVNNLLKIVFALIITFLFNVSVFAFNNETEVIQQYGSELNYNGKLKFHLKFYDIGDMEPVVFCTQFSRTTPAGKDKVCSLNNSWSKAVSVGVASIIEKVGKVTSAATDISTEKYYYGEIAINEFLCNSGVDTEYTCIHNREDINVTTVQELLGDYYSWYTDAISVRDAYNQASLSFSESKLIFTKEDDNYVSNSFKVIQKSFNGIAVSVNLQGSIGELKKDGDNYYVVIPETSVQAGSSMTVLVNATVSKEITIAQNYNCGDDYQDVTPNIVENDVLSKNASISGTITADVARGSLEITKTDKETTAKLSGVEFALYKGTECVGTELKKAITNKEGKAIFSDLELGSYAFIEVTPATGYKPNGTCQTVNVTSDKTVTIPITNEKLKGSLSITKKNSYGQLLDDVKFALYSGNSCDGTPKEGVTKDGKLVFDNLNLGNYSYKEIETISGYVLNNKCVPIQINTNTLEIKAELTNKKNKIEIIKISEEDSKSLTGAKLHVEDSEGNIVIEQWTTEDKPYVIEGLAIGTYYVIEDSAPKDYVLNKEKTKFEVKKDTENLKVEVKNKLITVEISKISAVDGKELKDATLQILDKDKQEMSCTVKKDEKSNEVLEKCTWVSGDKPKIVIGLEPGKYYLKETIAPEGYVLNEEMVEFEIKEDGTSEPVVMKNELEVEVPNTLSSRSTLLIAISMFDIALGIGILTYVKKHKIEE